MDENMAINTAMDRAAAWAYHRGDPADINEGHRNYGKRLKYILQMPMKQLE